MKHIIRQLPLVCLLLLTRAAAAQVSVFACEPEWAALAQEIGGKHVEASSATTALQDVHHIQARPSLIAKLRQADLLVCTGAGLESGWLPVLQRRANNPAVQTGAAGYLEATQYVKLLDRPAQIDRAAGDVHAQGNPHIQLDPRNYPPIAKAMAGRLAEIDPQHAGDYAAGLNDFLQRWASAMGGWQVQAQPLQGAQIVVHHDSWPYLADWLGLQRVGTLEPKPGVPPTSAHLSKLMQQLQEHDATAIIRSSYQNAKAADWLSQRTGLPIVVLPSTVGGNAEAQDLFGLFSDILQRLLAVTS
jgi:zinc/manganese transport system substrate-binding protein